MTRLVPDTTQETDHGPCAVEAGGAEKEPLQFDFALTGAAWLVCDSSVF
jgi:hypothetical protein